MKTEKETIFIYNFNRVLSLILSFFLIFSPMYAYSQNENSQDEKTENDSLLEEEASNRVQEYQRNVPSLIHNPQSELDQDLQKDPSYKLFFKSINAERDAWSHFYRGPISSFLLDSIRFSKIMFTTLAFKSMYMIARIQKKTSKKIRSFSPHKLENEIFIEGRTKHQSNIISILANEGITTVAQLNIMSDEELLEIPNIGKNRVRALREEQKKHRERKRKHPNKIADDTHKIENEIFIEGRTKQQSNIISILANNGITTLDQLNNIPDKDLLNIPRIGKKRVRYLREEQEKIERNTMTVSKKIQKKCQRFFRQLRTH